jgi:hypothetical protein
MNISSPLMNIQVNPKSVDNYSLSLDNIVSHFLENSMNIQSTHEHSSEPRKCDNYSLSLDNIVHIFWKIV